MADEGFLSRWSRRKVEARQGVELAPEPELEPSVPTCEPAPVDADARALVDPPAPACAPARESIAAPRLPTMDDVAQLTPESDFSSFVARGVDAAVRRSALKKLFADPHFNTMDRLDVYIDDYTQASPVSESMLASLKHAKRLFQRMVDDDEEAAPAATDVEPSNQETTTPTTPEAETR